MIAPRRYALHSFVPAALRMRAAGESLRREPAGGGGHRLVARLGRKEEPKLRGWENKKIKKNKK